VKLSAWLLGTVLVLLVPGAALAGQNPGVAFLDKRELTLTPDAGAALRTMKMCNVSDVTAQKPKPVISAFQKGTGAPIELMIASVSGTNGDEWAKGECRDVELTMTGATVPARGTTTSR
jgi:hypothetical protein